MSGDKTVSSCSRTDRGIVYPRMWVPGQGLRSAHPPFQDDRVLVSVRPVGTDVSGHPSGVGRGLILTVSRL